MNYLRISNKGLICPEDLMLIGSSTKRDATNKIGMFGSGWKYSLAWMLRNECAPVIYSGTDQIKIDSAIKLHRDNPVNVITVNDIETSLTTQMGPKWTGWMAIREVLSNAIDEGEHTITTQWDPIMSGSENQTIIFIPMNGELAEVMMKFDNYFAFYRKENYKDEQVRVFIKTEPSKQNVYRKGIRCYDTASESLLDFDFDSLNINEDRLATYWDIYRGVQSLIKRDIPLYLFKKILEENNSSYLPTECNDNILTQLTTMIEEGCNFTTPTLQKLGGMLFTKADAFVIPAEWYKKLQDLGLVKSIFDFGEDDESFIRTDARNVEGIKYHLKAFNIDMEIRSGKCDTEAFCKSRIAYIQDANNLSDKQMAAIIIKKMSTDDLMAFMD